MPRPAPDHAAVDAYIAAFPAPVRKRLTALRKAIRAAAPDAVERVSYRIPSYHQDGILIYFAGYDRHIGIYPAPRGAPELADELAGYAGGKGTVKIPHDAPLPLDLVRRIVEFRLRANRTVSRP